MNAHRTKFHGPTDVISIQNLHTPSPESGPVQAFNYRFVMSE